MKTALMIEMKRLIYLLAVMMSACTSSSESPEPQAPVVDGSEFMVVQYDDFEESYRFDHRLTPPHLAPNVAVSLAEGRGLRIAVLSIHESMLNFGFPRAIGVKHNGVVHSVNFIQAVESGHATPVNDRLLLIIDSLDTDFVLGLEALGVTHPPLIRFYSPDGNRDLVLTQNEQKALREMFAAYREVQRNPDALAKWR